MKPNEPEPGDERNVSFEVEEPVLDNLKPGFAMGEEEADEPEKASRDGMTDNRFPGRDGKDVPKASLADRIRERQKEG